MKPPLVRSEVYRPRPIGRGFAMLAWLLIGWLLAMSASAFARDDDTQQVRQHRPWEKVCPHPLPKDGEFTYQEQWAWNNRLCLGLTADLSLMPPEEGRTAVDSGNCDPAREIVLRHPASGEKSAEIVESRPMWPKTRILSAKFLHTILLHEPWRSAASRNMIAISCARFTDPLILSHEVIRPAVLITNSLFEEQVDILGTRFRGLASFAGSSFLKRVWADSAVFENRLFLRNGADFHDELRLVGTRINDNLEFSGSRFRKGITGDRLSVGGNIAASEWKPANANDPVKTTFNGGVNLQQVVVGGDLTLTSAVFDQVADFSSLQVVGEVFANRIKAGGNLFFSIGRIGGSFRADDSEFTGDLVVRATRISGNMVFAQAVIRKSISLEASTIEGSVFLRHAKLKGPGNFILTRVGQSVDLSNAEIEKELDFTQARIAGEFRLNASDTAPPKWLHGARLILRNTTAGALQATVESWRHTPWPGGCDRLQRAGDDRRACLVPIDVAGFEYDRLGGLKAADGVTMIDVPGATMVAWLAADPSHEERANPQPYQHLAKLLRNAGMSEKAEELVIAGREQRKRVACRRAGNYVSWKADAAWASIFGGEASDPKPRSASAGEWFTGDLWDCGWSEVLRVTVGYGLENGRIAVWLLAVVLVGFGVLASCNQAELARRGLPDYPSMWWYSVDMALPIIQLQDKHKHIVLPHLTMGYFNCQKIAGYVLLSLLLGSLAGLAAT